MESRRARKLRRKAHGWFSRGKSGEPWYCDGRCDEMGCRGHAEDPSVARFREALSLPEGTPLDTVEAIRIAVSEHAPLVIESLIDAAVKMAREEMRERCAVEAYRRDDHDEVGIAAGIANRIRALPLEAPR